MADYDEEEYPEEPWKCFVSRIPSKWTETLFFEHVRDMSFGTVSRVELFYGRKADARPANTRRGFGNMCYAFKNDGTCEKGDECLFSHDIAAEEVKEAATPAKKEGEGEAAEGNGPHAGNGFVAYVQPYLSQYIYIFLLMGIGWSDLI